MNIYVYEKMVNNTPFLPRPEIARIEAEKFSDAEDIFEERFRVRSSEMGNIFVRVEEKVEGK